MNTMKNAGMVVAAILGLGVFSCRPAAPLSKETMLREMYMFAMALGPDTATFATFAKAATADTATWSNMRTAWKGMRASFCATLGELGYGTGPFRWDYGPREGAALSQFQRDLGIPVTGRLDSLTVSHLARADKALKKADIKLPILTVSKSGSYLLAKGTWKAITNKLGYPVNTVDIVCDATRGECSVVTADFFSDELDQVTLRRNDLTVVHWSDDLVIAREGTGEDGVTLTINVPAKVVLWTQVNSGSTWPSGLAFPPSEMTLKLVNGMELSPPFDGGDLKEVHEALFKDKEKYLALRTKNTIIR